ncbi:MAG: hypothetical protein EXR77_05985 [Myxococcales bacterium]|nr:hypothetical protein [Myxococcales bacterium]
MTSIKTLLFWAATWSTLATFGCKKAEAPAQARPAPTAAPQPTETASTAVAPTLAGAATASAAPAPATATSQPEPATPTAPTATVAMFLDAGTGNAADLPVVNKPVKITITPIDEKGQPIRERDKVLGAELALIAVRYDLSWRVIQRAEKLSDAERHTHVFRLTFTKAGHHLLYFLFQPKGKPVATIPIDISVRGQAEAGVEWPELETEFSEGGLRVGLKLSSEAIKACDTVRVATVWTRKGEPLALAGSEGTPKVFYLALAESLGTPSIGVPITVSANLGGDVDTDSALHFTGGGHYKVLAIADIGAAAAPQITTAWFSLTAKGRPPAQGCP